MISSTFLDLVTLNSAAIFFVLVLLIVARNSITLFYRRHGRNHAMTGLLYLCLITLGLLDAADVVKFTVEWHRFTFDILLGVCGVVLTATAASDFQHKNIKNIASGTLDEHATVTYSEMVEHKFYQILNLVQIAYIHSFSYLADFIQRLGLTERGRYTNQFFPAMLLFFATYLWQFRSQFPINRFSDNFNKRDTRSSSLIRTMYRVKKYQYVFYKGFLLHGLNISLAMNAMPVAHSRDFRFYWILLNTAYVMEFFLQTLVKKRYLPQGAMLALNAILMAASTAAAIKVLILVNIFSALLSIVMNFTRRRADLSNTMIVYVASLLLHWSATQMQWI